MALRLSTYFAAMVLALGVVVAIQDALVGVFYVLACAAILIPLYVLRVPRRLFYIMMFAAAAIWLTHLLRVPFILALPEGFKYTRVGSITSPLIRGGLTDLALASLLLMLGLFVGLRAFARSRTIDKARRGASAHPPFLVRASVVVAALALGIFLVRFYLQLGLGLETKNVGSASVGFLSQLIPDFLLYPVVIVYLVKYRTAIPKFELAIFTGIAVGMIGLGVISGSRATFARLALAIFIFFLAEHGNFRMKLSRVLIVGAVTVGLLIMSFAAAPPIRQHFASGGTYDRELVDAVRDGFTSAFDPAVVPFLASAVSRRVSGGMDGLLAVELYRPQFLLDAFAPRNMAMKTLEKLVPRYRPKASMSVGKAIGVAYSGHSLDLRHSSNLGLFASLRMMFGKTGGLAAGFLIGLFWGGFFRLAEKVRDPDLIFLLHFIGMSQLLGWIMSGNLDVLVASTVINLVLLTVYCLAAGLITGAATSGQVRLELGLAER